MEVEEFLKNTITGILILSCTASIASVLIIKLIKEFTYNTFPRYRNKIKSMPKMRAFKLGYSSHHISNDETGRVATSYFFFHLSKVILWAILLSFCFIIFVILVVSKGSLSINFMLFIFPFIGFLAVYKLYDSYKYVHMMYLSSWGKAMDHAEECFYERYPDGVNKVEDSSNKSIKPD